MTLPSSSTIRQTIEQYLHLAATGSGAEIAAIYAEGATVEDPVGSAPHVGTEQIAAFYDSVRGAGRSIELITLRIAADTAAFHFRVTSPSAEAIVVTEPIDVMTFDSEGRITSMRAIWSQDDLVITPVER
ncbi:nuclear transport factor 2 family protein [Microbacterium sp. ZW T5_45]|uniref:nuclear transport factor 2 family protein n=1 Tax=Microbacterium sp. ZW T5_45 TaxID=3378080 RepID=UPI00385548CB